MTGSLRYRIQKQGAKSVVKKYATNWSIRILRFVLLVGICFIILYPFIDKIATSFMSADDLLDPTVVFVPRTFSFEFYSRAIEMLGLPSSFFSSLITSLTMAVLQTVSCTLAAYGFARFKSAFASIVFAFVIFTLLVPADLVLSPLYLQFRYFLGHFNLINSMWPLIILSVTCQGIKNGLYIFMMRQFFRGMPIELEEAAYIDGYGVYRTFLRIMLPNALSMMTTIFLFSFAWQWTDIQYTDIFLTSNQTMAIAAVQNFDINTVDIVIVNATRKTAMLIVIVPLLIVYIVCQKAFVQSVERSGLVG